MKTMILSLWSKVALMDFSDISGIVSDMDGVLWQGDESLPGLIEFFDLLREREIPYVLATNNSSKTRADYVSKLAGMGVLDVPEARIVTSGTATVSYLLAHYPTDTPIHVFGSDSLRLVVREAGYPLTNDEDARVVVAGLDWDLTYAKLRLAHTLIRRGADFIGTNPDTTYPAPGGPVPGTGSMLASLRASTGREPVIIGKPFAPMYEAALSVMGTPINRTLMIGDRLDTDISGAVTLGMRTALVLTGISTRADLNDGLRPDGVFDGLPGLIGALSSW
jgi:HAD superfamily hydrolase (TIGR01457 family)